MELHVWPSDFGLPSNDITCLQFMAAAKFCAAPITVVHTAASWKSPTGNFPYIQNEDEVISDFDAFVEFLRNSKQDVVLDSDMTPSQRCEFDAYSALIRHKLHPALTQLLWNDRYNYATVTQFWFSSQLSFPYNLFFLERRRSQIQAYIANIGRNESQLTFDAIQALNWLSAKLGDNKYFCGDKPSSLDALVFGYLAPLLKLPLPNDRLQLHLTSIPNLVRFVESIISIYLPLSEEEVRQQTAEKKGWSKRKSHAQKTLEDSKIRREQKKTEKENSKNFPLRDTILFAVGAVTLSVLFAVHTGILTFVTDERDDEMA